MDRATLQRWLDGFGSLRVAVVGDFFLDEYLVIDPALVERSVETGLEAHQVVAKRLSPGAAGTVACNLAALGIGTIQAVTVVGRDGAGYELVAGLAQRGIRTEHVVEDDARFTPTYTKPMVRRLNGSEVELSRLDVKNRTATPRRLEAAVIERLRAVLPDVDGVAVLDQVTERNHGVLSDAVRAEIALLARACPEKVFIGDARDRVGEFRDILVKPNAVEAVAAIDGSCNGVPARIDVERCGAELSRRIGRSVCVTMGADGILVYDGRDWQHVRTMSFEGPIDIVGAGDSVTAAMLAALVSGASLADAALFGNIVASVTVQQLGTTGTASSEQIFARYDEFASAGLV